jgi:ribonuclease J
VIFSAITIPGNEKPIEKMVTGLLEKGVRVINSENSEHVIHASGHPCQSDLSDMYQWVSPAVAIPVHGEAEHMQANANVAAQAGIKQQLVGQNGDVFQLAPRVGLLKSAVNVGRIDISGLPKTEP